jgi:hypothetical protein
MPGPPTLAPGFIALRGGGNAMRDDDDGAWEAWEMITGAACVRRAHVRAFVVVCLSVRAFVVVCLSVCLAATCQGLLVANILSHNKNNLNQIQTWTMLKCRS